MLRERSGMPPWRHFGVLWSIALCESVGTPFGKPGLKLCFGQEIRGDVQSSYHNRVKRMVGK